MPRPRPLILSSVVAAAAFSLLVAACGGGGGHSPGVANVAASTPAATTTPNAQAPASNAQPTTSSGQAGSANGGGLVAFANCMRSNGVPTFPEPQVVGGKEVKLTIHNLSGNNPQFQAAMRACNHFLPERGSGPSESAQQQRTQRADGLSFASCMRGHGVSRFPDPTAQGQLTVEMVQAQGIDIHSPAVLHAVQSCLPASHGLLTPAKVAEALNNAGG